MAKIKKAEDKTSPSEFHRLYANMGHRRIYYILGTPGVIISVPEILERMSPNADPNAQRKAIADKFL